MPTCLLPSHDTATEQLSDPADSYWFGVLVGVRVGVRSGVRVEKDTQTDSRLRLTAQVNCGVSRHPAAATDPCRGVSPRGRARHNGGRL